MFLPDTSGAHDIPIRRSFVFRKNRNDIIAFVQSASSRRRIESRTFRDSRGRRTDFIVWISGARETNLRAVAAVR